LNKTFLFFFQKNVEIRWNFFKRIVTDFVDFQKKIAPNLKDDWSRQHYFRLLFLICVIKCHMFVNNLNWMPAGLSKLMLIRQVSLNRLIKSKPFLIFSLWSFLANWWCHFSCLLDLITCNLFLCSRNLLFSFSHFGMYFWSNFCNRLMQKKQKVYQSIYTFCQLIIKLIHQTLTIAFWVGHKW